MSERRGRRMERETRERRTVRKSKHLEGQGEGIDHGVKDQLGNKREKQKEPVGFILTLDTSSHTHTQQF